MSTNTLVPDLPYVCEDPGCSCRVPNPYPQEVVSFDQDENGFVAVIYDEGQFLLLDVLRDHSLSELVSAVHRNYPYARKGKV